MIEKWKTENKRLVNSFPIFDVSMVERVHPVTDVRREFVVIDSPEWVNIIPLTSDNRVVMIKQYRHGVDDVTLEIPGGLVEVGEEACDAGMRECLEETGFGAMERAELLGITDPNPAYQYNKQYSFVWKDCSLQSAQNLDTNELIEVELIALAEIPELIRNGTIKHTLVLSAFLHYWLRYSF
ncbi:MAG: NUDIX hydrolase [Candidatus Kapabacteria bacterium]|nr:NUDIX hydrolase [Candidatus Kapabacteria bacterium]